MGAGRIQELGDDRNGRCILVRGQKDRCAWSKDQDHSLYRTCLRVSLVVQSWLWDLT